MSDFMTSLPELARRLKYSDRHLRRLAETIPSGIRSPGGHWRFDETNPEFQRWLAAQKTHVLRPKSKPKPPLTLSRKRQRLIEKMADAIDAKVPAVHADKLLALRVIQAVGKALFFNNIFRDPDAFPLTRGTLAL
jgi:hypothetical protein